jgi:hypothetical protein
MTALDNEKFNCVICGTSFGNYDDVQNHYDQDHNKNKKKPK